MRVCTLSFSVLVAATSTAHAQDEFEIQVYDSDTARVGEAGIEMHLNHHLIHAAPDQTHLTFEPHYGMYAWLELGGYFQSSLTTTGDLAYGGAKLRAKLRWPHKLWQDRLGLAINFELSDVPAQFEPNVYGSEIRPIIDLRVADLYAAVNPIVDTDLGGALAGHPQFQPCAKLAYVINDRAMVGAEGYGAFGPFDSLGSEDVLRAFATVDLRWKHVDLNAGIGVSTGIPDHPIVKLIVGLHP